VAQGDAVSRRITASWCAAALAAGCVAYPVPPAVYGAPGAASFERSWAAVQQAFVDQGIGITTADRASGLIAGQRGGIQVLGTVRAQADGSVRVQFDTRGNTASDPQLIERVNRSYDARMGR